jgi:hypothetical protein
MCEHNRSMPVLVHERVAAKSSRREVWSRAWWLVALFPVVYQWVLGIVPLKQGWDDAAITAAFARTWVDTGRIALTPGSQVVEGFSSVAWFLLLTPGYLIRGYPEFGLIWMKTLAAVFLLLAVERIYRIAVREFCSREAGVVAAVLLAWCFTSDQEVKNGMEMNLAAFLLLLLFELLRKEEQRGRVVLASGVGGLLLLTRFEMPFMLGLLFCGVWVSSRRREDKVRELLWVMVAIGLCFGAIEIWRYHVFGVWMPNTVYAKQWAPYVDRSSWVKMLGTRLGALHEPVRVLRFPLLIALAVGLRGIYRKTIAWREFRRVHPAIWMLAGGCFLFEALIGQNWGHAGRMVASMMPFLILAVVGVCWVAIGDRAVRAKVFMAMLVIHGAVWVRHAIEPYGIVSMATIEPVGIGADAIRVALGRERLVVMMSDVGASSLCCERLVVVDSGLLADATLARTGWGGLAAYFRRVNPEVVETHSFWARDAGIYEAGLLEGYSIVASDGVRFFVRDDLYRKLIEARVGRVMETRVVPACLALYSEDVRFSLGKGSCLVLNDPEAQRNLS